MCCNSVFLELESFSKEYTKSLSSGIVRDLKRSSAKEVISQGKSFFSTNCKQKVKIVQSPHVALQSTLWKGLHKTTLSNIHDA